MVRNKLKLCALALLGGVAAASQVKAVTVTTADWGLLSGPFTDSGTLTNQGTVLEATFTLNTASTLTIYTDSYGGGKNADGSTALPGGFMPSLVLYDGGGNFVAGQTFPSPIGNTDPTTGLNGDSYIKTSTLAMGSYTLALSDFLVQQPPTATNLSDGFTNLGSGTTFSDVQGNPRNGNYTVNITGAGSAPAVPEPATLLLMLPAALGTIIFRLRKRSVNE
jgi:hypothetical protein